jgi:hypothetical protein
MRRRRQCVARFDLDQPAVAQRACRRQGAPVRIVEQREGESKGWAAAAACAGTCGGKLCVHLDAGTQQQQRTLERRKTESLYDHIDRRRRRHRSLGRGDT